MGLPARMPGPEEYDRQVLVVCIAPAQEDLMTL